eukprot:TRINITY_DN13615_c0_g1_i1.p1 TRINITY_DN13615_c0_g1~~TRINITY_DN13615_c0_g1_i1.p1  ORF type:complete len:912 (+),score=148.59 TRINITY_DN13615_c0_g1_i1:354-2738(+)
MATCQSIANSAAEENSLRSHAGTEEYLAECLMALIGFFHDGASGSSSVETSPPMLGHFGDLPGLSGTVSRWAPLPGSATKMPRLQIVTNTSSSEDGQVASNLEAVSTAEAMSGRPQDKEEEIPAPAGHKGAMSGDAASPHWWERPPDQPAMPPMNMPPVALLDPHATPSGLGNASLPVQLPGGIATRVPAAPPSKAHAAPVSSTSSLPLVLLGAPSVRETNISATLPVQLPRLSKAATAPVLSESSTYSIAINASRGLSGAPVETSSVVFAASPLRPASAQNVQTAVGAAIAPVRSPVLDLHRGGILNALLELGFSSVLEDDLDDGLGFFDRRVASATPSSNGSHVAQEDLSNETGACISDTITCIRHELAEFMETTSSSLCLESASEALAFAEDPQNGCFEECVFHSGGIERDEHGQVVSSSVCALCVDCETDAPVECSAQVLIHFPDGECPSEEERGSGSVAEWFQDAPSVAFPWEADPELTKLVVLQTAKDNPWKTDDSKARHTYRCKSENRSVRIEDSVPNTSGVETVAPQLRDVNAVPFHSTGIFWLVKHAAVWIQALYGPLAATGGSMIDRGVTESVETLGIATGGPFLMGNRLVSDFRGNTYFNGYRIMEVKPIFYREGLVTAWRSHVAHVDLASKSPNHSFISLTETVLKLPLGVWITALASGDQLDWRIVHKSLLGSTSGRCGAWVTTTGAAGTVRQSGEAVDHAIEVDRSSRLFRKGDHEAPMGLINCSSSCREKMQDKCRSLSADLQDGQDWVGICVFDACFHGDHGALPEQRKTIIEKVRMA